MAGHLFAVPVPVYIWPESAHLLRPASQMSSDLLVLGVTTPSTANRDFGRQHIRLALRQALAVLLERPSEAIQLTSAPGQALQIDVPDQPNQRIGLSISHEPGLTLGAICLHGAVGIDLMRVENQVDWHPVARDYLGPHACARIAAHPPALRPLAFAQEWTRREACLKCHGQALTEWQPTLEHDMLRCRMSALDLPAGLVGTVATLS